MATDPKLFEIADKLSKLTVKEAIELVRILEEDYDIKAPELSVTNFGPAECPVAPVEKTEFNVYLMEAGPQKLQVVKAVKDITGFGLKESKELVDRAPCILKEKINKAEVEIIKTTLENLGAKCDIQ